MSTSSLRAAQPLALSERLRLRNRLVGTAHGAGLVVDGLAQPADAEYWRRRAAGGIAMLTVGGTVTAPESTWRRRIVTEAWREEAIPGMARRAEAIRGEGAVAACQLVHLGRETTGAEMWFAPVAPSPVRSPREPVRPRPLGDQELDGIVEGFRVSAANAAVAGFEVVELHAAHGYLLAQFLSPLTNLRAGATSAAERVGIVARIVDAIRASAPELVLGIRLSLEGEQEAGHTVESLCELLALLDPLVDYVNVTAGVRTTYVKDMGTETPPLLHLIGALRAVCASPLLISQAFRHGEEIEQALAAGADLVGMARPLVADADFPVKLLRGRSREIRPCVSCNEDCRAFDPVLLCSVSPDLAPPGHSRRPAAPLSVRSGGARAGGPVAIVGAGPAGLECASFLAGRREVVLFDEQGRIGGHLAIAASAPHRHGWQELLDFYAAALAAAERTTLRLGRAASAADLEAFDDVVIACGSVEALPALPGVERALSASEAIAAGAAGLAGRSHVVVVDDGFGSWLGASAVELAVSAGAGRVTLLTPAPAFAAGLPAEGRVQLIGRLRGAPVTIRALTALAGVQDGAVEALSVLSGETESIAADAVVVVGERRARDWSALVPYGPSVQIIGDALVPRRVGPAVSEGRAAAEAILARVPAGGPVGAAA